MSKLKAPHIRTESSYGKMVFDVSLSIIPLGVLAFVNYGLRPILLVLAAIATALLCEALCCMMRRRPLRTVKDGTAAITGLLIGLVMSPMADYWVPMVAAAFAILVAKAPFGGTGRNVFNPAAAGIALITFCFPHQIFTYPALSKTPLPLDMSIADSVVIAPSLAEQLRSGAAPSLTPLELLLGDFAGPIGGTASLILIAFAVYLLVRRTASLWVMAPYFITCIVLAWMFPVSVMNPTFNMLTQLCSGYVIFTGVFLLNDPVTTPRFWLGRLWYGFFTACLVMLLQHIGQAQAGCCFAILMMNALSPIIDRWSWHFWHWVTNKLRIRKEVKAYE